MQLKPKSGMQIPDPEKGGYLPPEGRNVEPTSYWLRRITDGDVVEVKSTTTANRKGADK